MKQMMDGLLGLGTIKQPYVMQMKRGDTIIRQIKDFSNVAIDKGSIYNDHFVEATVNASVEIVKHAYLKCTTYHDTQSFSIRVTNIQTHHNIFIQVMLEEMMVNNRLYILAIGNSFTEDAMTYLYDVVSSTGIKNICLGYLYRGGAPLHTHVNNLLEDVPYEFFRINQNGTWKEKNVLTTKQALDFWDWDIISLQQSSGESGLKKTYFDDIEIMVSQIKKYLRRPIEFIWHQTWAYSLLSTHDHFKYYDYSQKTMYSGISEAIQQVIIPSQHFYRWIPAGMLIQQLRKKYQEAHITRDGFHLSLHLGRYAVALLWFKKLTGLSLDQVTFVPKDKNRRLITKEDEQYIKDVIEMIVKNPEMIVSI